MKKLKEHKFSNNSFIGGWYISEKICDKIINFYKNNPKSVVEGNTGTDKIKIDKDIKESLEIGLKPDTSFPPFYEYRMALQLCLDEYIKKYPFLQRVDNFNITEGYNIQYYKPNGGFKHWHCEITHPKSSKRVLTFMTYLNDVPDGGTEFFYQKTITPAKKGLTLIWPAHFTHFHKGQISKKYEKYIITGWYTFVN